MGRDETRGFVVMDVLWSGVKGGAPKLNICDIHVGPMTLKSVDILVQFDNNQELSTTVVKQKLP